MIWFSKTYIFIYYYTTKEGMRVTKSLKVNPDLWKEAKKHAIDKDMELSEYIEGLIEKDLKTMHA